MGRWFIQGRCHFMASFRNSLTTSPDRPNPSWHVTQRIQKMCRNYNDIQIRLRPGVYTSEITGRPITLHALPRRGTVRPLQRLDGVSPNLFTNLTRSLTTTFSHRGYTGARASEASLPLHAGSDQPDPEP
jgi:hypothetical protein